MVIICFVVYIIVASYWLEKYLICDLPVLESVMSQYDEDKATQAGDFIGVVCDDLL